MNVAKKPAGRSDGELCYCAVLEFFIRTADCGAGISRITLL
jgi:hypothetical protein